jgi:site-specific DNA-methyltransferase (adenine-specific)
LFDELDAEFHFTVDVASLPSNALCARFFTPDDDGLAQDWTGERCWMNPPYSLIAPWTEKAAISEALTVGLLPVRTDLAWFHDDVLAAGAEVRFIRGRVRFYEDRIDGEVAKGRGNAPFPSMVVVWRNA